MALKKAAASKEKMRAMSLNPDDFKGGGLPDDFDGKITAARFMIFDYNGTRADDPSVAVELDITPDEKYGLAPFQHQLTVAKLSLFGPSKDGRKLVDFDSDDKDDLSGPYVVPRYDLEVEKEGLPKNSNFSNFLTALVQAGFDRAEMTANIEWLVGLYGHWNRILPPGRSGLVVQKTEESEGGEQKRKGDGKLLVLTELKEEKAAGKAKAKASAKAAAADDDDDDDAPAPKKGAAAKAAPKLGAGVKNLKKEIAADEDEDEDDDAPAAGPHDEKLTSIIEAMLEKKETVTVGAIAKKVVAAGFSPKTQEAAITRAQDSDFLGADEAPWVYDEDEGTVSRVPADDDEDEDDDE